MVAMLSARVGSLVLAMLVNGCGGAPEGATPKAKPTAPSPEPAPKPTTAEPTPKPTPVPYAPLRALPEITVTAPTTACPELPALPGDASEARKALHPYAGALRRLACEPELFGRSTSELREALGLPAEAEVDFSGLRGARLRLPGAPTVADVAAVFGIAAPQIYVTWQAYHPRTSLGTNPSTGAFDLWGPGKVWLGVAHEVDRYGDDVGKVAILPAPPELGVDLTVMVGMPDDVVAMKPDPDAIPLVISALEQLAARPEQLAGKPDEVAAQVGLAGERFRIAETSLHSRDRVTRGVSIDPRRTTLPAAELAAALGLSNPKATSVNREHDVWNMSAGETTQIGWKGLELELQLSSPEGNAETQPLGDLEVTFLTVMPAGS